MSPSLGLLRPYQEQRQATRGKGGAAHTITEECERLFCDTLRAVFLGEEEHAMQESLVMGAFSDRDLRADPAMLGADRLQQHARRQLQYQELQQRLDQAVTTQLGTPPDDHKVHGTLTSTSLISQYVEVWDYVGGAHIRGFTARDMHGDNSLVVFFDHAVLSRDLKQGLIALLELAAHPDLCCSSLTVALSRENELGSTSDTQPLVKDLGWIGFAPVTLQQWTGDLTRTSDTWFFMGMEV